MRKSQTLQEPFTIAGIGIHTGATTRVEVRPATAPTGRCFHRNGTAIPALVDCVTDTRRCTTLGRAGQTVSTVEHLLAALLLAEIDHVDIYVEGPELPALDGSAAQWYSAIRAAGVRPLGGEIPAWCCCEARWFVADECQFFVMPSRELVVYAALAIPETVAECMLAGGPVARPEVNEQIVRARTFGLEREVRALLDAGLAQGGSLDNAVILTPTGYLNAQVWPEEPAWHKVLDLLGDLALAGRPIAGHILAVKNGHRGNVQFVEFLRNACAE